MSRIDKLSGNNNQPRFRGREAAAARCRACGFSNPRRYPVELGPSFVLVRPDSSLCDEEDTRDPLGAVKLSTSVEISLERCEDNVRRRGLGRGRPATSL
jgi:hypothetical protein